jgi:cell division protein FtsL
MNKIILLLFIIIVAVIIYQQYQQHAMIEELYNIVQIREEILRTHTFALKEMAIDQDILLEMIEVVTGKMIWEMEW